MRRVMIGGLTLAAGALLAAAPAPPRDELARALEAELRRSIEELRLGEQPMPYFVAYRVEDVEMTDVAASLGGLVTSRSSHSRSLFAEVRVGEPSFDNTNFFAFPTAPSGVARSFRGRVLVPLEDDYRELRRQAWLLTDGAYKEALDRLSRKTAALQNRQRTDDLPDFTAVEPSRTEAPGRAPAIDRAEAEDLVRDLSRLLRAFPALQASEVHLQTSFVETRYIDSEGMSFRRGLPLVRLSAWAERQADDGRPLADAIAFYGHSLGDLPERERAAAAIRELGSWLERAGSGGLLERYNGPVLLEAPAAAELLVRSLVPRLVGFRRPVAEDPRIEQRLEELSGGFNDKLGGRVLARFMRLVDDPTLASYEGTPLVGGYPVDDDGVTAAPTVLVERGILKGLLAARSPSPGVPASTGNRRGAGAAPSNLILESDQTASRQELERELLALVAERDLEFGVVIERIANPQLVTGRRREAAAGRQGGSDRVGGVIAAHKLFPDGRREPLRNLEIVGLGASSFRDFIAAAQEPVVYSAPLAAGDRLARLTGARDVAPLALSVVTPALLIEELTLKTPDDPVPNLPVVPPPHLDATAR